MKWSDRACVGFTRALLQFHFQFIKTKNPIIFFCHKFHLLQLRKAVWFFFSLRNYLVFSFNHIIACATRIWRIAHTSILIHMIANNNNNHLVEYHGWTWTLQWKSHETWMSNQSVRLFHSMMIPIWCSIDSSCSFDSRRWNRLHWNWQNKIELYFIPVPSQSMVMAKRWSQIHSRNDSHVVDTVNLRQTHKQRRIPARLWSWEKQSKKFTPSI